MYCSRQQREQGMFVKFMSPPLPKPFKHPHKKIVLCLTSGWAKILPSAIPSSHIWETIMQSFIAIRSLAAKLRAELRSIHCDLDLCLNSYSASHDNWCTETLWNRVITAQCEGTGEVGSARYEPALLPPCPSIRVLCYSNCQRSTHSSSRAWQCKC